MYQYLFNHHDCDIWHLALDAPNPDMRCLSPDEQSRCNRRVNESLRLRFANAHVGMREILSRYVDVAPEAIAFTKGQYDKPYLYPDTGWQFNLSHSADKGLLAVGQVERVGVDIEQQRNTRDLSALAKRFFTAREHRELLACGEDDFVRRFYQLWCAKEAFIKAVGQGMSYSLDAIDIGFSGGEPYIRTVGEAEQQTRWILEELSVKDGYSAALVVGHPLCELV